MLESSSVVVSLVIIVDTLGQLDFHRSEYVFLFIFNRTILKSRVMYDLFDSMCI